MQGRALPGTWQAELGNRLDAYAAAYLSPNPVRTAAVRASVMVEARRLLVPAAATPEPIVAPRGLPRLFTGWRRASFALAAATLAGLMLGTSVFAASSAGGPLYGTRLWLETATLPSDANARAAAELQRLQSRLGDAADAAVRGDGNAVSAALAAYRASVEDALAAAGDDHDRLARLEIELGRHEVVLQTLLGLVPTSARDAIQAVLDKDKHALDVIQQHSQPGSNGGSNGPPADKPGQDGGGGGSGGGNPGGGPPADKPTPRPDHTPKGPPQTPRSRGGD
ncbi:MAG: hypothetical protein E6I94_05370 [Chloroflexi bacterium]|nr:MAG: hypothetical protein E6I94_05370 [Chloroflexota bacterium]